MSTPDHDQPADLPQATPSAAEPGITGRESTLATPALSGREATLETPATGVSGRESTLATPAIPISGRETTLETPSTEPRRGTTGTGMPAATPMTPAIGSTDRPHSGGTTGFDEEWQLHAGRTGSFTGQTWGDFAISGLLGEGGMGAVYRAWQRSLKRRVALKVLPSNLSANERLLARFKLEASAASKLQSAHVVQVYAIGEHEGHHYYAMEYVEGKDLHDLLRERREAGKPITPTEAADYILQAAKGLVEASSKGIVHRDIKPPNLLLTKDGVVKIADFGIVKVLGERNVTMTGQAVGTPAYISPEQGRGDRQLDARSDLYSLGVVFYELASGDRPFAGNTPNALIYQHCYDEPRLPREINLDITPEIQAIILRCMQKKPENRYQSAAELVRDLDGIRTGNLVRSAIAHYQLTTGAKEAKREQMTWVQRHLVPVAAASLLVIAGGVGGGWWVIDRNQRDTLERERRTLVGEKAVADQRAALAGIMDAVAAIPEDIDDQLATFATRAPAGEQDQDLIRWKTKLISVRSLEARLAPLSDATPGLQARRAGRSDLEALVTKVGTGVPAAERAKNRLDALDAEESRLRLICAQIDTTALRLGERRRFGDQLASLTALSSADDPQVAKWKMRLATFDQELAALRTRIAPLDDAKQITIAERSAFLPVLNDLRSYLDDNDPDLLRWRDKLEGADRRIARLREDIIAVVGPQPERIAKPKQAQIADKLADLESLVGKDDPQVKDWQNAIAGTERAIAGARQRLAERAKDSSDGVIPQPAHVAFERDVALLATLAAEGDTEHLAYEQQLVESRRHLDGLRADCAVLEATATNPITLADQKILTLKLERLATKGALDQERAQLYRDRLANEAKRVADLHVALGALDQAISFTPALEGGLDRFIIDAGKEDPDVSRWSTKRERIRNLQERLSAIDRREGIPEQVESLFLDLEKLVGDQDPLLQGWRDKVTRITEARTTLRVLDQRETYDDGEIRKRLVDFGELVGTGDRIVQRWQAKVDEVTRLESALASLDRALALPQAEHALAHDQLKQLSELVGPSDPQVRQAATRLIELDGPPRPSWAAEMGRDIHGLWADAALPGGTLRFRFVASGSFVMGSPDTEPGRNTDELPFRAILPNGFWIADSETPRAIWMAVMGKDPSWTPLFDAAVQPAERMSWSEAQAFCLALSRVVPELTARLPLEAEWEYACRAGSAMPWDIPEGMPSSETISKIAWHHGNTGEGAQASRSRLPNRLGLYDMHGNLHEWCADGYGPYPTTDTVISAPATGTDRRVLRGGSWGDVWTKTRSAHRISASSEVRSAYVGLRLAVAVDWAGRPLDSSTLVARLAASSNEGTPRMHQVSTGDTLSGLARLRINDQDPEALRLSELMLLSANPWLKDRQPLPVGSWMMIPPSTWRAHLIADGETLDSIARNVLGTDTSVEDITRINPWLSGLPSLPAGRVVMLPAVPSAPKASQDTGYPDKP